MFVPTPCVCGEPGSFITYYSNIKTVQNRLNPWLINSSAWDSPCASKAWQCVTSERAGAFSVPPPNWSTAVLWQPACRMRDTPSRRYCVTHRSPVTCRGPSPGVGEAKGHPHFRQGSVKEALCSAPWKPLTHRRACRAWPTLHRGKCLTLALILILTNPIMLLTYVRLLCDFCIVWISKCLCF